MATVHADELAAVRTAAIQEVKEAQAAAHQASRRATTAMAVAEARQASLRAATEVLAALAAR